MHNKLIRLTSPNGNFVWVNIAHVTSISGDDSGTAVNLTNGDFVVVQEKTEYVVSLFPQEFPS